MTKPCKACEKRRKAERFSGIEKYDAKLIERMILREHAPLLKGIDRMAKEFLTQLDDAAQLPEIPEGYEAKVRLIPKVTIQKIKV